MKRREFITALGAAATWPLAARAQQSTERVYKIGYLQIASREQQLHLLKAFEDGLQSLGYRVGANVVIEPRFAHGELARLPALAADLVQSGVDIIVTEFFLPGTRGEENRAAQGFAAADDPGRCAHEPRQSCCHRGGVTGDADHRPVPQSGTLIFGICFVGPPRALFERMQQGPAAAVAVSDDSMLIANIRAIAAIATTRRLVSIGNKEFAQAGGLMGYGIDFLPPTAGQQCLWTGSSRVADPLIFRSSRPQNSTWSSISRQPRRSASPSRRPCSPSPTR